MTVHQFHRTCALPKGMRTEARFDRLDYVGLHHDAAAARKNHARISLKPQSRSRSLGLSSGRRRRQANPPGHGFFSAKSKSAGIVNNQKKGLPFLIAGVEVLSPHEWGFTRWNMPIMIIF
jgi:hypothetical protein